MTVGDVGTRNFNYRDIHYTIDYYLSDQTVWGEEPAENHLWMVILISIGASVVGRIKHREPNSILHQPDSIIELAALREVRAYLYGGGPFLSQRWDSWSQFGTGNAKACG